MPYSYFLHGWNIKWNLIQRMILEYHYHLIQNLYWRKNHNDKESENRTQTDEDKTNS